MISKQEVVASIGKLKSGKSAGPDNILSDMLNRANEAVIDFLVERFLKSGQNHTLCLLHKKGD